MSRSKTERPRLSLGLRMAQAVFLLQILLACVNAAFINVDAFDYDLSLYRALPVVALDAVCIWLIYKRASITRPFGICGILFCAALFIADYLAGTGYDIALSIGESTLYALVVLQVVVYAAVVIYLAFAPSAKEALCLSLSELPTSEMVSIDEPLREQFKTWPFWRNLAFYFIAFSFIGHWVEIAFCWLIRFGIVMGEYDPTNHMLWDQWLYPFSAEGIALVLIVLIMYPLKNYLTHKFGGRIAAALPISFLVNGLLCTSIDFGIGITCNLDYHLWDYRDMPFNFMGQICLQNSLAYTTAATLIVWLVYPLMQKGISRVSGWLADVVFWAFAGMYAFLAMLHFVVV